MRRSIPQFLTYLATERNASDLTIKAYREDLFGLVDWLEATRGSVPQTRFANAARLACLPSCALQQADYARTTISRKLASLRSFYRFAMRQGIASTNPAKPLRNPRASAQTSARVDQRGSRATVDCTVTRDRRRSARSCDSGNDVLGRFASQRTGRSLRR